MKVCLDLHDFSIVDNRFELLLKLKNHFPRLKLSLFTIAVDEKRDWGPSLIREDFLEGIKQNMGWLEIVPHALKHEGAEVKTLNYSMFKHSYLPEMLSIFDDSGIPYAEGFGAPHWKWNRDIVLALNDMDWWGAVDRDKDMILPNRYYKYNFLLNEPFWESDLPLLKLHGHVYGTNNDIGRCVQNLIKLPRDTEFVFASECLEDNETV